jgi:hypothetical protein
MQSASFPQASAFMRQRVRADVGLAISLLQGSSDAQSATDASERFNAVSRVNVPLELLAHNASGHGSCAQGFDDLGAAPFDFDFSRQTSGAAEEFESVPAWSRQVSAWGYKPSKVMGRFDDDSTETSDPRDVVSSVSGGSLTCQEEQSSEGRASDSSDDGKSTGENGLTSSHGKSTGSNEDDALDVLQAMSFESQPKFPFQRQESEQSASSIFLVSESLGLRCTVKNTFFDIDPAPASKTRTRLTRSVSPTLMSRDADWEEPLELDCYGLKRQTTT